jgi:hypothetical protein
MLLRRAVGSSPTTVTAAAACSSSPSFAFQKSFSPLLSTSSSTTSSLFNQQQQRQQVRFKSDDAGDVIGIDLGTTNSCVAIMVRSTYMSLLIINLSVVGQRLLLKALLIVGIETKRNFEPSQSMEEGGRRRVQSFFLIHNHNVGLDCISICLSLSNTPSLTQK